MYVFLGTGWGTKIKTHFYESKLKKKEEISIWSKNIFLNFKYSLTNYLVHYFPAVLRNLINA